MSGNGDKGGGTGFGGGGGAATTAADCKNASIKTSIISPDPTILSTLSTRSALNVDLQTATGPLIATTDTGDILGAIFTINPTLLINCISQGYSYKATILSISGGDCQVLITAK